MISQADTIRIILGKRELADCIQNASIILQSITDRADLHARDELERFYNILMGEIAESMVQKWLKDNGKTVISAINKQSGKADDGHDLLLTSKDGCPIKCSVKSSLSYKKDLAGIIDDFKLASTQHEIREVNIQVYFWLRLEVGKNDSRRTLPTLENCAIIGWFGSKDLQTFGTYNHEQRQVPKVPLKHARPMQSLLALIV